MRDALEVLLGTSTRLGEVLALRPVDVVDGRRGMVLRVNGTIVYRNGKGTFRQEWPKTEASVRALPVPDFAAAVIRSRLQAMGSDQAEATIFHNRSGGPLSLHNFRRTFREFLKLAELEDSGITPRWYRRTGATVLARGIGIEAAATFLGHTSTAVTEGHYIEPDRTIDFAPATVLERTLRAVDPDGVLLAAVESDEEEFALDSLDPGDDDVAWSPAQSPRSGVARRSGTWINAACRSAREGPGPKDSTAGRGRSSRTVLTTSSSSALVTRW